MSSNERQALDELQEEILKKKDLEGNLLVVFSRPRKQREFLRRNRPQEIGKWMPGIKRIRVSDSKHDWREFGIEDLIEGKQYYGMPKNDLWMKWINSEQNPARNTDITDNGIATLPQS
ncbi:MAG: hypothetical protein ACRDFS_11940 [Chloroflexota bacterium]